MRSGAWRHGNEHRRACQHHRHGAARYGRWKGRRTDHVVTQFVDRSERNRRPESPSDVKPRDNSQQGRGRRGKFRSGVHHLTTPQTAEFPSMVIEATSSLRFLRVAVPRNRGLLGCAVRASRRIPYSRWCRSDPGRGVDCTLAAATGPRQTADSLNRQSRWYA